MNKKTTFVLCHDHEEIRALLKNMLIENGYFHIDETTSSEEAYSLLKEDTFLLVPLEKLSVNLKEKLKHFKQFILFVNSSTVNHTTVIELGIKNTLSFPYSSKSLMEKIKTILD